MARSITSIKQSIVAQKNSETALSGLNSNSQVAIWNLWAFITATAINLHEQIWDLLKIEIEEIAAKAVPGTAKWLQDRAKKFQFGDVVQVNSDFSVGYPTINTVNQIITQASVKQGGNRIAVIKVAKGTTPSFTALSATELAAFTSYIDKIKFAGTQTHIISLNSDKLKVFADVYYDGQYVQTTVKTNVINAITNYLSNLPFDGTVKLQSIVDVIQGVNGVTDVVLTNVIARNDSVSITSNQVINMVVGSDWMNSTYPTEAGYIVPETTATHTLNDGINMILSV